MFTYLITYSYGYDDDVDNFRVSAHTQREATKLFKAIFAYNKILSVKRLYRTSPAPAPTPTPIRNIELSMPTPTSDSFVNETERR